MSTWEYARLIESIGTENIRMDADGDEFYVIEFETAQTRDYLVRTGASQRRITQHLTELGKQGWELTGIESDDDFTPPTENESGGALLLTNFWLKRQID